MSCSSHIKSGAFLLSYFLVHLSLASSAAAMSQDTRVHPEASAAHSETYIFSGKCHNGSTYRLDAYQMEVNGLWQSFYHYEGPVGKGTVQTETAPKVMAQRVCRKFAEIISASYWEDPIAHAPAVMRK